MANILRLLVAMDLQMGASGLFTPLHFAHCTIYQVRRISIGNACIGSCAAQSTDDFVRMTGEWERQGTKAKLPHRRICCGLVIGKAEGLARSRTGAQISKPQLAIAIGDYFAMQNATSLP